jgi:hypothetical protein
MPYKAEPAVSGTATMTTSTGDFLGSVIDSAHAVAQMNLFCPNSILRESYANSILCLTL